MHGGILRQLRLAKSRSQADVARAVGISPAHLARLESSQRGLYLEDFVRIAEALGEKPGNLLPNDLGDIGHLKPLIDRLTAVSPAALPHVAAILGEVVKLAAGRETVPPAPAKRKSRAVASKQGAPRKTRR